MKSLFPILGALMMLFGCEPSADVLNETVTEVVEVATAPTEEVETETETEVVKSPLWGKVIVVDAGHGISSYTKKEPMAPGSSEMKNAFVSGTRGANQTEEQLNLAVALKLQKALEEQGVTVHMTRTEHKCEMSNVDRARLGNEVNADISVRIHADGSENQSAHGVSVLVPGSAYIKDADMLKSSRSAGDAVLKAFVEETGAKNRGVSVRNDMTGFNWSEVPSILVEMGFMTNPNEDKLMETEEYQNKIVNGIVKGLATYFNS